MKNRLSVVLLITVLATILIGLLTRVANAAEDKVKKEIKGTVKVEIDIACEMLLLQGNESYIELTGDKELLNEVIVKYHDGKVRVYSESDRWTSRDEIVIVVMLPDLKEIEIGGAVNLKAPKPLKYSHLNLEVSGVGNIEMNLKAEVLNIEAGGVLNLELKGNTNKFNMDLGGTFKIDAESFIAQTGEVNLSGVGKANVHFTDNLDASISGVGKLEYSGNAVVNGHVSGLGKITKN